MLIRIPDQTTIFLADREVMLDSSLTFEGGFIRFEQTDGLHILLKSVVQGVCYIQMRWNTPVMGDVKVLGDTWERGYGNLHWGRIDPDRNMPWYMAVSNGSDSDRDYSGRHTQCFGVGVLPNCFALWNCDRDGITLTLDVRSGAAPVYLGDRVLDCATVYTADYTDISAFEAVKRFCHIMSPAPLLADHVVYGSNNWYYAYGKSSREEILADTRLVADLCRDEHNPPYMVIDDGWQPHSVNAPWDRGNERFPDMSRLATEIAAMGVRPGIWVRYLINGEKGQRYVEDFPEECYSRRNSFVLDPSHPLVLDYVRRTTERIIDWGYTLIKHDFSCYDLFGKWGFKMSRFPADDDETWSFYDNTRTSAEIIKSFHMTIRESAGNAVILGCNIMGHLCAGIHHCNRTGDDTSGREWTRTLKMGVNTLAFRMAQNKTFFSADADCVGILGLIDWMYNRQWLDLLARSGSPLFVSCKPDIPTPEELDDLRRAYAKGSLQADELIPLDWMETPYPSSYLINGEEVHYDWGETVSTLVDPETGNPR